jgi:hypothetical protein
MPYRDPIKGRTEAKPAIVPRRHPGPFLEDESVPAVIYDAQSWRPLEPAEPPTCKEIVAPPVFIVSVAIFAVLLVLVREATWDVAQFSPENERIMFDAKVVAHGGAIDVDDGQRCSLELVDTPEVPGWRGPRWCHVNIVCPKVRQSYLTGGCPARWSDEGERFGFRYYSNETEVGYAWLALGSAR